jgi:Tfx family DNA-binding protein
MENIRRAKGTLDLYAMLDARYLCTLEAGSDLVGSAPRILEEARKTGITVTAEFIDLINRLREEYPEGIHGRLIREDIKVFLRDDGELYFA